MPYNNNMLAFQSFIVKNRVLLGTLVVLLAMALLAGGWSIPFHFESFSILYKFGKLKIYLRYGKVIGITIALLLFFQVLLAARLQILIHIFSAKNVFMFGYSNVGSTATVQSTTTNGVTWNSSVVLGANQTCRLGRSDENRTGKVLPWPPKIRCPRHGSRLPHRRSSTSLELPGRSTRS